MEFSEKETLIMRIMKNAKHPITFGHYRVTMYQDDFLDIVDELKGLKP